MLKVLCSLCCLVPRTEIAFTHFLEVLLSVDFYRNLFLHCCFSNCFDDESFLFSAFLTN